MLTFKIIDLVKHIYRYIDRSRWDMLNGIKIGKKWKLIVPFTKKYLTNNIYKKKLGKCMKTWVIFQQMHLCFKCSNISTVICFSENNVTAYNEKNSRVLMI